MGGLICQHYASAFPESVAWMVLLSPAGLMDPVPALLCARVFCCCCLSGLLTSMFSGRDSQVQEWKKDFIDGESKVAQAAIKNQLALFDFRPCMCKIYTYVDVKLCL
jgi:pimeloyl-ACP methyl ester carboxylesterase